MPTSSQRLIGAVLIASGVAFTIAGLALGTSLDPIWTGLVAVGLSDIVFGALFMTGRLGTPSDPAEEEGAGGSPEPRNSAEADGQSSRYASDRATHDASSFEPDPRAGNDPDYNPYVRDD